VTFYAGRIMAEGHNKPVQTAFLADLVACTSTSACRHIEARSAQEWWQRWKDFKVNFVRGFRPPEQWRTFQTRYIGRAQGKVGELARQFTPRFAESPLQALHNFTVGITVARITRVIAVRGLDIRVLDSCMTEESRGDSAWHGTRSRP
jgi:hypothetical protein